MASHMSRMILRGAKSKGMSCASVYLDLTRAFDSMQRSLVMPTFRFDIEEHELGQLIAGRKPALVEHQVPDELMIQTETSHVQSWISVEGVGKLMAISAGSKQGDSYGSNMFNIAMSVALTRLDKRIEMASMKICLARPNRWLQDDENNNDDNNNDHNDKIDNNHNNHDHHKSNKNNIHVIDDSDEEHNNDNHDDDNNDNNTMSAKCVETENTLGGINSSSDLHICTGNPIPEKNDYVETHENDQHDAHQSHYHIPPPHVIDDQTQDNLSKQIPIDEISYIDDCNLILLEQAKHIRANLDNLVGVMDSEMAKAGMTINYGPGKTEALLHVAGSGSKEVKRQIMEQGHTVVLTNASTDRIRLSTVYKHLGTLSHQSTSIEAELRARIMQANIVLKNLRGILKDEGISKQKRFEVIKVFIATKLLWGSHTWPPYHPSRSID